MDNIQTSLDLLTAYPALVDLLALSRTEALFMAYTIGVLAGEIAQLEKRALQRDLDEFEAEHRNGMRDA